LLAAAFVAVGNGQTSQGALIIAGGTASLSRSLIVGVGQGATGTVSIMGGQLEVTNQQVMLGSFGAGQMTVSSGGFRARSVVVGNYKGSQGALTISGGITSMTSNLVAGVFSNATGLIQISGGELDVTNQLGTAQLVVGQLGSGTFVQTGGVVTVDQLSVTNGTNSVFNLYAGSLASRSTTVSNAQPFVVGDGIGQAGFRLLGGVHSFANGLRIRTNSYLTGCGTITGNVVVDAGGRVLADCGSRLTFTGILTNNGILRAANGSVLESYGTVVNNGLIDILYGTTNFHGSFINNGLVLSVGNVPRFILIQTTGEDLQVQFTTVNNLKHVLEATTDLISGSWLPSTNFDGTGGSVMWIDPGAALLPQRFYRIRLEVPQ
jgi:hypothetical protein